MLEGTTSPANLELLTPENNFGYPFVPGKHGIPITQLCDQSGTVQTGSGRVLKYLLDDENFYFVDHIDNFLYLLSAELMHFKDALFFNLKTRNVDTSFHHPDMRAGKFVDAAFAYFNSRSTRHHIQFVKSLWFPDSINYNEYVDHLAKGLEPELAARQTWTGRTIARHGFVDAYVPTTIQDEEDENITVLFERIQT